MNETWYDDSSEAMRTCMAAVRCSSAAAADDVASCISNRAIDRATNERATIKEIDVD
jgi:hypothetical protein